MKALKFEKFLDFFPIFCAEKKKSNFAYSSNNIDDRRFIGHFLIFFTRLIANQRPQFVNIDRRTVINVRTFVIIPHTDFSKIAGMVFVEIDSMMVLTTSITCNSNYTWFFLSSYFK